MNPTKGEGQQVNFELPPQVPSPEAENKRQEKGSEAPPARPEQVGKQAPTALPALPIDLPTADTPIIAAPQDDTVTRPTAPHPADDNDRIEHQWVDKAKAIIAQTRDDPYQQKNQMSKVKAEYIEKRFNKQIKTDEPSK
jgi:hypothetical protein